MTDRRSETVDRKDILDKIEKLSILVATGMTELKVETANVVRRLDTLNGKVAEHERSFGEIRVKDAVQAAMLDSVKKQQDIDVEDHKKSSFITREKLLGAFFTLLGTGLVALVTFWLTHS